VNNGHHEESIRIVLPTSQFGAEEASIKVDDQQVKNLVPIYVVRFGLFCVTSFGWQQTGHIPFDTTYWLSELSHLPSLLFESFFFLLLFP